MLKSGKLSRLVLFLSLFTALAAGSAFALLGLGKFEKVKAVNGLVSIPLAKVGDGKAHYFKYAADGKEIAFFLVKAEDGTVKSSFDACDVCFKEKKGYEQKGSDMICRNCNRKFAISRIGSHESGGCNPSYFPHNETAGNIVIKVADLKVGGRFF